MVGLMHAWHKVVAAYCWVYDQHDLLVFLTQKL